MNDQDLEARLRTHLHRRFDDAAPSPELVASIEQLVTTSAATVGVQGLRFRPSTRWTLAFGAAVAAVVVVALAATNLGPHAGPGGPGGSPTSPAPTNTSVEREFLVLPPSTTVPPKATTSIAGDVLAARVQALGVANFASSAGDVIFFTIPIGGPTDAALRAVLAAPGEVTFVPLPASDYGAGKLAAEIGKPLPKVEPVLFGWDGVAAASRSTDATPAPLSITLTTSGAAAYASYATTNAGEDLAVVLDGTVAMLAPIGPYVPGSAIWMSPTIAEGETFDEAAAILVGGRLPDAWRGSTVPTVISRIDASARAIAQSPPGATVHDLGLNGEVIAGAWRAVWNVELDVSLPIPCPSTSSDPASCLGIPSTELVKLDAVTGAVISTQVPAPPPPTP